MSKEKLVYISGKVTGEDYNECYQKFNDAATKLSKLGIGCINPMFHILPGTDWDQAMHSCIKLLFKCDAIYLLNDWTSSKGARVEFDVAQSLKMEVFTENTPDIVLKNFNCVSYAK